VTSTCGGRERAAGLGPHSEVGSVGLLRLPGSRIRCFGWPEAVLVHHRRVTTSLTVAVVQPPCIACDVAGNAQQHADAVRRAQARVVVFPELSLTGYELDAPAVAPDEAALAPIVGACAKSGAVALVGAPVQDRDGQVFIAVLQVDAAGVRVEYRKTWLGTCRAYTR